jgi:hypothetical protein
VPTNDEQAICIIFPKTGICLSLAVSIMSHNSRIGVSKQILYIYR